MASKRSGLLGSGSARPQDAEWLSSLSELELDFLISLKEMATLRAKQAGHKDLGDKFDLGILRALGAVMLEYFKDRLQSTSLFPNSPEISTVLGDSGLAAQNQEGNSGSLPHTEDTANTSTLPTTQRKRLWEGLCEVRSSRYKKRKKAEADA